MMKTNPAPLLLLAPLLLAGCGDTARTFGLTRDAPDEFQVTTRAPLSMPPSLGSLPTPRPGASRPQELSTREQAESTLVPGAGLAAARAPQSSGERALLSSTGTPVPDNIRDRVDEESMRLERVDRNIVDRALFWRPAPPAPGIPVDAARESQRLRENAALGRDLSEGATPIIQPQRRPWYDALKFW
ncbi:DUF3035 domain-containing protein [Roseococcus sp. SDR]|uniref:DUF3035 domain-containing protein n=1 Tax=Roseococcus sp. SDR TaxID=2835532 RepID=UPI001BCDFC59|nr:DUF3035 domain-containing protein [Roseococcus sp. SDR]MBS7788576.1 DUF3035 domain-containing protein [Roseococcus sp. SDR]MBV1843890.1 DUF3035 domain-containing protein [Roseococcus sp. SDR]